MSPTYKIFIIAALLSNFSLACTTDSLPRPEVPQATVTLPLLSTPTPESGAGPSQPADLESATVSQVIDGDTIELSSGRRVRYIGINTPERNQPYYEEATEANRRLVAGQQIQLELDVETFDQYGRRLAYVWAEGRLVNLEVVRQGYASSFTVPPNVRYEGLFREAEREARAAERGLWAGSSVTLKIRHIEANAPGDDRQNPNGEWVEIVNTGDSPVEMRGYTLSDAANKVYTFANFTARPGVPFRLYSGQGQDSPEALYWGFKGESVWNNDTDSAFLRDQTGALIDALSY